MPELPEVETLKLGLQKYVVGHKILDIDVRIPKIFQGSASQIIGAKIVSIKRIGKGLIIELDNKYVLAVHLKMTGQLIYRGKETENIILSPKAGGDLPSKYSHVIFALDKNAKLFYNDLRQFGWIKVIKKTDVKNMAFFREMGPEPAVAKAMTGKPLTFNYFKEVVKKGKIAIKVLLMDQRRIGGIGNIYANESLFKAGIDPRRKSNTLSGKEIAKLFKAVRLVLEKGLKYGGSSDENFINALGQEGAYQQYFLAYNRKGQKCIQCKENILKIKLGSRGTYYCPTCQK